MRGFESRQPNQERTAQGAGSLGRFCCKVHTKVHTSGFRNFFNFYASLNGSSLRTLSFLSTPPIRRAIFTAAEWRLFLLISIHAPREGSDGKSSVKRTAHSYFYPRSPRGERQKPKGAIQTMKQFLSTLPARGATQRLPRGGGLCKFLSTLPARGATTATGGLECTSRFLSTLPARGATAKVVLPEPGIPISIHAPREGSDIAKATKLSSAIISIHAPREGSDCKVEQ